MLNDISPKIESYGTPRFRSSHFPIRTRCLPTYCIAIIKKYFWREFDKDIQNCWTSFQFLSLQLRILILSLELSARNTFSILHQFDFQIFLTKLYVTKRKIYIKNRNSSRLEQTLVSIHITLVFICITLVSIFFTLMGPMLCYVMRKTVRKNKVNEKDFYTMDMQTPYMVVLITLVPSGWK